MAIERVFEAFAAALPGPVWSGPDESDQHIAAPRISWEPMTATHAQGQGISGGAGNEGVLWQRHLLVRVKLWGRSLEETEALLEAFVNVIEIQLSRPGYDLVREEWSTGGVDSTGRVVELQVVIRVPIPRTPKPTKLLTAINATFRMNDTEV